MTSYQLIFCTCPDLACAQALAQQLVEAKLAACVNILPGLQSFYHWQGQIETASECLLLIKSSQARYAELEAVLQQRHPYTLPEIIAVPITQGLPAYLSWLGQSLASNPQ